MIRIVVAMVLALSLGACTERNPEAERAAFEATRPWLDSMDAGDYDQCWQAAAPLFRDQESLEAWTAKAHEYRDPLGALQSRQLNVTHVLTDPWGAPPGQYAVVVYDSHWAAGSIYESVHVQRQPDGTWLVAGYRVRQQ